MKTIIVVVLLSLLFVTNVSALSERINRGTINSINLEKQIVVIDNHILKLMKGALIVKKSAPYVVVPLSVDIVGKEVVFDLRDLPGSIPLIQLIEIQD